MNALRALAEHDRDREAPPDVEARILRGFRQVRKRQMLRRVQTWLAVGAAAAVAVLLVWAPGERVESLKTAAEPVAQPLDVVIAEPALAASEPQTVREAATAPRREIVTQFFLLTDSALPLERGQLLRVRVPASTMRAVGLPVNPERWAERVDADVLVGEEGMARAIRFVGYEQ